MFSRPYVTNTYLTVMLPSDKIKKQWQIFGNFQTWDSHVNFFIPVAFALSNTSWVSFETVPKTSTH